MTGRIDPTHRVADLHERIGSFLHEMKLGDWKKAYKGMVRAGGRAVKLNARTFSIEIECAPSSFNGDDEPKKYDEERASDDFYSQDEGPERPDSDEFEDVVADALHDGKITKKQHDYFVQVAQKFVKQVTTDAMEGDRAFRDALKTHGAGYMAYAKSGMRDSNSVPPFDKSRFVRKAKGSGFLPFSDKEFLARMAYTERTRGLLDAALRAINKDDALYRAFDSAVDELMDKAEELYDYYYGDGQSNAFHEWFSQNMDAYEEEPDGDDEDVALDRATKWAKKNLLLEWRVELDGTPAIEFVAGFLTRKSLPNLRRDLDTMYDKLKTGSSYSAHVHIGVEKDAVDKFERLAVTITNDEDAFVNDPDRIGAKRKRSGNLEHWSTPMLARLANELVDGNDEPLVRNVADVYTQFATKYSGVNMSPTSTAGPIEFRYPSSEVLVDIPMYIDTINYWLTLVHAQARRRLVVTGQYGTRGRFIMVREGEHDDGLITFVPKGKVIPTHFRNLLRKYGRLSYDDANRAQRDVDKSKPFDRAVTLDHFRREPTKAGRAWVARQNPNVDPEHP